MKVNTMVTEPLNTVRATAGADVEDCHCVVVEIGQYRIVGGFDAHAWADLSPEDARDCARNLLAAAAEVEKRQARDRDDHVGVGV